MFIIRPSLVNFLEIEARVVIALSKPNANAKSLEVNVYFAHPYRSLDRALNENTNGRLNTRPRKTLKFKTPNQRWLEMAA